MLTYKGYKGQFEVDAEAGVIFGRVLEIRDVVTFQGKTVEEAVQAFHDSIDDYLEFCREIGEKPNKPFSGKLPFRTNPENHRLIYIAAKKAGKSINAWMDEVLSRAAEEVLEQKAVVQSRKSKLSRAAGEVLRQEAVVQPRKSESKEMAHT